MCVAIYVSIYLYMHGYTHTSKRRDSLENLWDSTAGSAFLLFKENLHKKAYVQSKTSQL